MGRTGKSKHTTSKTKRKKALSYELPSELSENQIEADVAAYFGFVSALAGRFGAFRLDSLDEQEFGADKRFDDVVDATAYFLQFKKPTALRPVDPQEALAPLPPSAGPKQHIRRFRSLEDLEQTPYSICFRLRDRAKTAADFQHNVLLRYEAPPQSRAVYICPLSISKEDYRRSMDPGLSEMYPFPFLQLQSLRDASNVIYCAQRVPFLRGHAAIVPHATVSSAEHYYSFSTHATDIVFHSPQRLQNRPSRLSDYVATQIGHLVAREEREFVSLGQLAGQLRQLAQPWIEAEPNVLPPHEPLEWLRWHGRQLWKQFGIRQILVLRRSPRRAVLKQAATLYDHLLSEEESSDLE